MLHRLRACGLFVGLSDDRRFFVLVLIFLVFLFLVTIVVGDLAAAWCWCRRWACEFVEQSLPSPLQVAMSLQWRL